MVTQRYLLYLSYIGTNFSGSQILNAGNVANVKSTVQGSLESGLCQFLGVTGFRPIITQGCSRTDAGVHALKTAFHVDIPIYIYYFVNIHSIKTFLNKYFRENKLDIKVLEVLKVSDKFHAKYSAVEKTYMFRVAHWKPEFHAKKKSALKIPIVEYNRTYFSMIREFDIEKAKEVGKLYLGEKDFGAFVKHPSKNQVHTICNIKSFDIKKGGPLMPDFDSLSDCFDYYHITVTGNRFLYCMVRRMVGVLLSVAGNVFTMDIVRNLFDKPVGSSWNSKTAVPLGCGLYLLGPVYKSEDLVLTEEEVEEKKARFMEERKLQREAKNQPEILVTSDAKS